MVAGLMTFGVSNLVVAQNEQTQTEQTEQVVQKETPAPAVAEETTPVQKQDAAPLALSFSRLLRKAV